MIFTFTEFIRTFPRLIKFFFQRVFRGWDDSETWDFEESFLKWALPRLKRVRKISIAYPKDFTEDSWDNFQDILIQRTENALEGFQNIGGMTLDEEESFRKEVQEVIQIIADNLSNLSW